MKAPHINGVQLPQYQIIMGIKSHLCVPVFCTWHANVLSQPVMTSLMFQRRVDQHLEEIKIGVTQGYECFMV